MMAKGRYKPSKVITDEIKDAIRAAYATGTYKQYEVQKEYDVCNVTVMRIVKGYPGSWYLFKYKPEFIKEIKELHSAGNHTYREIASLYGLSFDMVGRIIRSKR
jgi:transposase